MTLANLDDGQNDLCPTTVSDETLSYYESMSEVGDGGKPPKSFVAWVTTEKVGLYGEYK